MSSHGGLLWDGMAGFLHLAAYWSVTHIASRSVLSQHRANRKKRLIRYSHTKEFVFSVRSMFVAFLASGIGH
jgi:hypothetical protein